MISCRQPTFPSGPCEYDLSLLTGPHPLQFARSGSDPTAKKKYEEAALLLIGDGTYNLPGLLNVHSAYDITSYQYALWRLFTPDSAMSGHGVPEINPSDSDLLLNTVRAESLLHPGFQGAYSRLRVFTPGPSAASNQEFLQVGSVPEPATQTMAAAGTLLLLLFAVRAEPFPLGGSDRAFVRSNVRCALIFRQTRPGRVVLGL